MIESIKKAFILSVKAVKLFYIVAAVNILANVVNLLVIPAPVEAEMSVGRSFLVLGIAILFLLIAIFITGGMLAYVKDLVKAGTANLAPFIDNSKKYFVRILCLGLILLAIFIIGILVNRILAFLPNALRVIVMILISVAVGIFLVMAPYALVANELRVVESLKKGISVARKNFAKILGLILIMLGIYIVLLIAASVIIAILSLILRPLSSYITAIVIAIAMAVQAVLVNIAYMDFYLKSAEIKSAESR